MRSDPELYDVSPYRDRPKLRWPGGKPVAVWIADQVGLAAWVEWAWRWLRYPAVVLLLMLTTGIAYSLLPNVAGFRWISPGAVLAVVFWIGLSIGFRAYIANFGRYNVLYGSVGAVIVLLLYFWMSSIVLLVGGEVNAVLHRESIRGGPPPRG